MKEVPMQTITVTLLANAGVLLTFGSYRILIDGFQNSQQHSFSQIPDWVSSAMAGGILQDIDFLLFTHSHPDHFFKETLLDYLTHHKVRGVYLPRDAEGALVRKKCLQKDVWIEKTEQALTGNIYLKALPTRHMGEVYRKQNHHAFLLTLGDWVLLFTADAETSKENFAEVEEVPLDAVFVNPLFFHSRQGRELLKTTLTSPHVIVYHLCFAEEDRYGYRAMTERNRNRYVSDFAKISLLKEVQQSIVI